MANEPALVIDFATGNAVSLPKDWSLESGGKNAALFAANMKATSSQLAEPYRSHWASFRLMGSVSMTFTFKDEETAMNFKAATLSYKPNIRPTVMGSPWSADGNPTAGCLDGMIAISSLLKFLEANGAKPILDDAFVENLGLEAYWQLRWLNLVKQMNEPGGQWGAPFMLPLIPREHFCVKGRQTSFSVNLYTGRLLFYLIADDALADIMLPLEPVGPKQPTAVVGNQREDVFTQGKTRVSPFSVTGIMRSSENTGYVEAEQPKGIALPMKSYQLQTLAWMLDQERLARGLNGCFWEARAWDPYYVFSDGPNVSSWGKKGGRSAQVKQSFSEGIVNEEYFVSLSLGEFRLEKPPLVRGGLLCEEMGLGKTLELVALIMATKKSPPCQPLVSPRTQGTTSTNATLVIVPDTLIPQWKQEIMKSCHPSSQLKLFTYLPNVAKKRKPDGTGDLTQFLDCDICLTTFRTVELDKTLQKLMWRRVVIDEMQLIRSSTTMVAKMCENLSAHCRWMVSGTPLFSSVKDLNGLLNFLNIIPFSLSDAKDGFWNQRLGKPLADHDPAALDLLNHLLDCIMMRHSKAQLYKCGPLAGRSILELPSIQSELFGVPFVDYIEEGAYRHMEALGLRASEMQLQMVQGNRQDRPAVVAVEALRSLAISASLLAGGNGVSGDLAKIARLWRALVPISFEDLEYIPGMPVKVSGKVDLFANPIAMPGEKVRDFFLAKTANNADKKALGENDIAQRLEQAQEDIKRNRLTLTFKKAGSFEGLPWRRWKWLFRCISSGRYHLAMLSRVKLKIAVLTEAQQGRVGNEISRLIRECPILFRRCMQSFRSLRSFAQAEVLYETRLVQYAQESPESLLSRLGLPYTVRSNVQVEVTEGYFETHERLLFRTLQLAGFPTKPPTLLETIRETQGRELENGRILGTDSNADIGIPHPDDEEDDDVGTDGDDRIEDDEDSLGDKWVNPQSRRAMSTSVRNHRALASSGMPSAKELRATQKRNQLERSEAEKGRADQFDFLAHEDFWRKACYKILMQTHKSQRKRCDDLRLVWETTSHPGWGNFSVPQIVHCGKLNSDLCFEALFWYNATGLGDKSARRWFRVDGEPSCFQDDPTRAKVTFVDGQERVVDKTELRLVSSAYFASDIMMSEGGVGEVTGLGLRVALNHLRLTGFESKFEDLIDQPGDLSRALLLDHHDLFTRFMSDKDAVQLAKLETELNTAKGIAMNSRKSRQIRELREQISKRVQRFLGAQLLESTRLLTNTLFACRREIFTALQAAGSSVLSKDEVVELVSRFLPKPFDARVWNHLWTIHDGDKSGESLDWITVALGLKGNFVEVGSKIFIAHDLEKLERNTAILVRITSDNMFGSMVSGWFRGRVLKVPIARLDEPPRWTVALPLKTAPDFKMIVAADEIRPAPDAATGEENLGKKKKKKAQASKEQGDEDDEKRDEVEVEHGRNHKRARVLLDPQDDLDSGRDEHKLNEDIEDIDENIEGNLTNKEIDMITEFSNGLIRLKLLGSAFNATIAAKEKERSLVTDIIASTTALPDLENFEALLLKAIERAGSAGAQLASQHGFQALEQLIEPDPKVEAPKCTICHEELSIKGPVVLGCLHIYCRECLLLLKLNHDRTMASMPPNYRKPLPCPLCRRDVNPKEMFLVLPPKKPERSSATSTTTRSDDSSGLNIEPSLAPRWTRAFTEDEVRDAFNELPEGVENWDLLSGHFTGLPRTFQTFLRLAAGVPVLGCASTVMTDRISGKLRQVVADVKATVGKVVIFSQYSKAIKLMMTVLEQNGIRAVKVARGDDVDEMRMAIESFTLDEDVKAFVIHSGSGAAGLTLTVAHQVFLLEPFLRAGEEAQAVNRVHRIGQFHSVRSVCYFMRNSVEERILAWRKGLPHNGSQNLPQAPSVAVAAEEEEEEESGLVVLAGQEDAAKSIGAFSNDFLGFVLGANDKIA